MSAQGQPAGSDSPAGKTGWFISIGRFFRSVGEGFFLDVPYLADSAWRHLEFAWNAELRYPPDAHGNFAPRPFWHKPPFWLFAIVLMFVSYGPTWHALCSIGPPRLMRGLMSAAGAAFIVGSIWLTVLLFRKNVEKVRKRLKRVADRLHAAGRELSPSRRNTVWIVTSAGVLALGAIGFVVGWAMISPDADARACAVPSFEWLSVWRAVLCAAGILGFAWIASRPRITLTQQIVAQGLILALISVVQWLGLSSMQSTEASDLPYRHVFAVLAPAVCLVTLLAPALGEMVFEGRLFSRWKVARGLSPATHRRLATVLSRTELFVNRPDPLLNWRRILSAIAYGPGYHPLQLLLPPALVALVVPANVLYLAAIVALLGAGLCLTWGNVSSRWQQIVIYIERWFLSGTPLLVSLFVIVIAALRLCKVDYVSTILDAVPFGTVFAFVVMNYALFWLVEYWLNRVAALYLLRLLGAVRAELYTPYPLVRPDRRILVEQQGRVLASHGTGRFVAVGKLMPKPGEPPPQQPAFQTYGLVELFAAIAEGDKDHERVSEISRRTGVYFFALNALIFAVLATFVTMLLVEEYRYNNLAEPVVTAQQKPSEAPAVDLAALLAQQAKDSRPALVVVASGGGTRAALYTSSVLRGLHRLGRDRDVVLASGVSGGGAALAYFAAHRDRLVGPAKPADAAGCSGTGGAPDPEVEWLCFDKGVTQAFIEDVLNGASEWRVFRHSSLSQLLTESFERRLLGKVKLGDVPRPALILNSTVVGHPQDESQLLKSTVDPAASSDCFELERPFGEMNGGRLVLTNLGDDWHVPGETIPDVRLPYTVVNDRTVELAQAAAVNANFPPVFANARVRLASGDSRCPNRSFYVTDGGAEENLGLISALYALRNAIGRLPAGGVPEIHLVIIEASAVGMDYAQDRGLSAILGGSRERLAGGLANALLADVSARMQARGANRGLAIHDLTLPLAFRARGGFGTHWMYAKQFELHDPRPRSSSWLDFFKVASLSPATATVDRTALEALWSALHDPDPQAFCARTYGNDDAMNVKAWICGSRDGPTEVRDQHLAQWAGLVQSLGGGAPVREGKAQSEKP